MIKSPVGNITTVSDGLEAVVDNTYSLGLPEKYITYKTEVVTDRFEVTDTPKLEFELSKKPSGGIIFDTVEIVVHPFNSIYSALPRDQGYTTPEDIDSDDEAIINVIRNFYNLNNIELSVVAAKYYIYYGGLIAQYREELPHLKLTYPLTDYTLTDSKFILSQTEVDLLKSSNYKPALEDYFLYLINLVREFEGLGVIDNSVVIKELKELDPLLNYHLLLTDVIISYITIKEDTNGT